MSTEIHKPTMTRWLIGVAISADREGELEGCGTRRAMTYGDSRNRNAAADPCVLGGNPRLQKWRMVTKP